MALPPAFLDELRARTPLSAIIGRRVKLARSGKQWKGCCPFHGEKTPSFYVYEDGFHCFGCGAHGDAISFVMQTQGCNFPEAVSQLAGEAGLEVPKATPEAAAAERRRTDLHAVLEATCAAYQNRLWGRDGERALAYLRGRGLGDDTIREHGIGWSGEARGAVVAELARDGIDATSLVEAGVLRAGEDGRAPYDLFAGRVMFPIRDAQGRAVSLGGRILGDGQPKYLNGPETAVFSKRRTLFGLDRARMGVRAGHRLVVVEGYLDVIALHQAGFAAAVAPLGTALTDLQLAALWRLSPSPVLCFDGDAAGARAAARAVSVALPLLTPEQTLAVARLPPDEDPDSLLRRQGRASFEAVLQAARPLGDSLFDLLREGTGSSPEQRAGLRARLEEAAAQIRHPGLAREYRAALLDRFFAETRQRRRGGAPAGAHAQVRHAPVRHAPVRPARDIASSDLERCRILVVLLMNHPAILLAEEEMFARLDLPAALDDLRAAMLAWAHDAGSLDVKGLTDHLASAGLSTQAATCAWATETSLPACARVDAMPAEALSGFWHFVGLLRRTYLDEEIRAATLDFAQRCDDVRQHRLVALHLARAQLIDADLATDAA